MSIATTKEVAHIGESQGAANHDHDMVHELSKRLDSLWRYDQYVVNAEGHTELQNFWRKLKEQDQENVRQLKAMIAEHCKNDCF